MGSIILYPLLGGFIGGLFFSVPFAISITFDDGFGDGLKVFLMISGFAFCIGFLPALLTAIVLIAKRYTQNQGLLLPFKLGFFITATLVFLVSVIIFLSDNNNENIAEYIYSTLLFAVFLGGMGAVVSTTLSKLFLPKLPENF